MVDTASLWRWLIGLFVVLTLASGFVVTSFGQGRPILGDRVGQAAEFLRSEILTRVPVAARQTQPQLPVAAATSKPTAMPTRPAIVAGQQQVAITPKRTPTPAVPAVVLVRVANTNGLGVYLRRTPAIDDRLKAFPDGTDLTIVGDDVDAGGLHWRHVVAPDGTTGYVPAQYVSDVQ